VLDRFQLFRTLQLQDRVPGARLGHCAVALGFVPANAIERLHLVYALSEPESPEPAPDLETMATEAFARADFAIDVEGSAEVDPAVDEDVDLDVEID
jgi:hypothetical protein